MILVVDDDMAMRRLLGDVLRDAGCLVIEAANGAEALTQLNMVTPDLVVTDLKMHSGGFEYIRNLKTTLPKCPVIVVTAFGDAHSKKQAMESGVAAYFDKPMHIGDLKKTIWQTLGIADYQGP
ncbi:MAG: response regulator [Nitrospirales bacterium]|nr:response regulator [Nitrospirales bacterium]